MVLHYETCEGETIHYYDVLSLYHYVCKYFKILVRHPTIDVSAACRDKQPMLSKEGLLKCTVLPPKRLYHPVLQYRCSNKILFCLCRTCAFECIFSGECVQNSTEQRSLK